MMIVLFVTVIVIMIRCRCSFDDDDACDDDCAGIVVDVAI